MPDHIVVHHTASANTMDYSLAQAFELSHWIQDLHTAIVGHRDYVATLCPGDVLYARLPELRDRVAQAMGA